MVPISPVPVGDRLPARKLDPGHCPQDARVRAAANPDMRMPTTAELRAARRLILKRDDLYTEEEQAVAEAWLPSQ